MRFYGLGLLSVLPLVGQSPSPTVVRPEIPALANPSLAVVLAGSSNKQPAVAGAAIAIRQNGVLLTAYHLIKEARALQVRLSDGETFDRLQLLGVDARRDVAAIRITGSLPAVPEMATGQISEGEALGIVSWSAPANWNMSQGIVSAYTMADHVPGAGQGYLVIRFTAPGQHPVNTGVLLNGHGEPLALITGDGFAVPLESVQGLADEPPGKIFASGTSLTLPPSAVAWPATPPAPETSRTAPAAPKVKEDRAALLRSVKTIYVDPGRSAVLGSAEMEQALRSNQSLAYLGLEVVDQPDRADAILLLDRGSAGNYPFEVTSPAGTVLLRGIGVGLSSAAGARDVAKYLAQLIRPFRPANPSAK